MKLKFLVLDSENLIKDLESNEADDALEAVICNSVQEALDTIKEASFVTIFINEAIGKKEVISFTREFLKLQPKKPIFLLSSNKIKQFPRDQMNTYEITNYLKTPSSFEEIKKFITPLNRNIDFDKLLDFSKKKNDQIDVALDETDKNFVPIASDQFMAGSRSFFDVYIRLKSDHYVKFINAGEPYDEKQVQNYLNKGIKSFYIRKEAQEEYLRYVDKISKAIIQNENTKKETKIEQSLNFGEQAKEFLKQNGISPESLKVADRFVGRVHHLIDKLDFRKNPDFGPFLKNLHLYDHGTSLSVIMGLMLDELEMSSEKAVQIVGLASFMHDVGLTINDLPEDRQKLLVTDQVSTLTEEEKEIYYNHPKRGAELLEDDGKVNPTVYQIVKEHHMTRGEKSFPAMKRAHTHYIAELVGIADELLNVMELVTSGKEKHHPLEVMEHTRFEFFSGRCVEIFIRSFGLKRK